MGYAIIFHMSETLNIKSLDASQRYCLKQLCALKYAQGESQAEIVRSLRIARSTINRWVMALEDAGGDVEKLREKRRGTRPGTTGKLNEEQKQQVSNILIEKTPDQLKFNFALWSSKAIAQYLRTTYKMEIADRTVRAYMKSWGFTPQRPIRRAYEQNPTLVKEWKEKTYPQIVQRAKAENGEIHWGDETCVRAHAQRPRGYAPCGKTPVASMVVNMGVKVSMISTVTNTGKLRFMFIKGSMNAEIFIEFMQRLIDESDKKIFLIVDNLKVHHAKMLKPWLEKNETKIELHYLPSYSPELNPDEYLNNDLKQGMNQKAPARTKEQLTDDVRTHLENRQAQPDVVKSFFNNKYVTYAS